MGELVRFDPQITERHRQLPAWVTPRVAPAEQPGAAPSEGWTAARDGHLLNPSAVAIRDLCDGGRSIFEVVATLRGRYVAGDAELYVDVTSTVVELRRLGLLAAAAIDAPDRPPTKFVMGIEDKTYFHWQLPILFESLIGQLPKDWQILVVVCNDHQPLSASLLRIFDTYGVTSFTGVDHGRHENMDFASGGDHYSPLNRIEALRVVAPHVRDDDLVFLLDTDNFLYRELDFSILPRGNALSANELIDHRPFFTYGRGGAGVDLQKLLRSIGCQARLGTGGVAVFLAGWTVRKKKFLKDCFRFAQVVYLLGKIAGLKTRNTWISEMPCFALSLTANGIPYQVLEGKAFMVHKSQSVPPGTFYHYYGDLKDTSVEGAFYDSDWHKQRYFDADFLDTSLDEHYRAAVTPHEQYFFELAQRARHRLLTPALAPAAAVGQAQ